ncbi:metallophosphoesterase [Thalassomonas haliotis]|uniref:Metallophosphoesterase n=1 Tax=Thalassomonas haliotis TaxID=485448 RepID=A0ABY7VHL6_9GAMM|nr:metallophosphoesterase [Thalassomonas haliotis]WDE13018.1 metallophosphoesterase [Thalassomonas haliotis]
MPASAITLAQISDCHLFADKNALHCGVNVYDNLKRVLTELSDNNTLDYLVFTGDLSQDHSEGSYRHFADLVRQANLKVPVYFLPGNHDDETLLNKYLTVPCFHPGKVIEHLRWQVCLLSSKGDTPAGYLSGQSLQQLKQAVNPGKSQLIFMHHHPVAVGYFIDRHGLTNADEFWQLTEKLPSVKAVACGHVHRGLTLLPENSGYPLVVHTCPATSIQFDPDSETVSALAQGPGYRLFTLNEDATVNSRVSYLEFL